MIGAFSRFLRNPLVYQAFQRCGGFFGARLRAIDAYLPMRPGDKVVDIGCGPGFIVERLAPGISYRGYDTDAAYIAYARRKFGERGRFECRLFDVSTARECAPVDIVMMNGLLHHLSDDQVHGTLDVAKQALAKDGRLFTLDGCIVEGQSTLARYLLEHDRGEHVRTPERYRALMAAHFTRVDAHVDHSLSWVPYSWQIMVGYR